MYARLREGLRAAGPALLLLLAFAAAILLPQLGFALTMPRRPGEFVGAMRAHVAWARAIAVILALGAALLLARQARRNARGAAGAAAAVFALCATVGVAASLPAYDAWVIDEARARYTAPGWNVQDEATLAADHLAFGAQQSFPNATGAQRLAFPELEKGDRYMAFVNFREGTPSNFWRTEVTLASNDACFSSEAQLPPPPSAVGGGDTTFWRDCTARAEGPRELSARWGAADEPVDVTMGAVVMPVKAVEIDARADGSLVLVALFGGVGATIAYATALGRSRSARLALAVPPVLVCLLWAAAALTPRVERDYPAPDATAAWSFALLALVGAAVACARLLHALRGRAALAGAIRSAALCGAAVTMLVPLAAARVWPQGIPWVVLGMVGAMLVCAAPLAALRTRARVAEGAPPTQA